MNLVADPVARPGKFQAVLLRHGLNEPVVIGVHETGLQGVVVDVGHRKVRLHPGHPHGLEFQIGHGAGRILGQSLVNAETDFRSRRHIPFSQMRLDDFLCNCKSHFSASFRISMFYFSSSMLLMLFWAC